MKYLLAWYLGIFGGAPIAAGIAAWLSLGAMGAFLVGAMIGAGCYVVGLVVGEKIDKL